MAFLAKRKELISWSFFDFANSSYTTIIITVIYGNVFTSLLVPSNPSQDNPYALGNSLWALALALSYFIVAFFGPLLGALCDLRPYKKKFLFYSYVLCILASSSLYFAHSPNLYILAFFLVILSNLAFSFGENFISSFLPFLASKESLGKLSGYAWGLGYFGGILSVILIRLLIGDTSAENFQNLAWVGPLTALFFLVTGLPTFLYLREPQLKVKLPFSAFSVYKKLAETSKSLVYYKDLFLFFLSLFFCLAGLSIVISFSFIYARQEINLSGTQEVIAFVLTNISAAIGAVFFGRMQDRWSPVKVFMLTLLFWILTTLILYFLKEIHLLLRLSMSLPSFFLVFSFFAGLSLGATQAGGRAIVALFSPEAKIGEFFGLWGMTSKASYALALLGLAFLQNLFGLHNSILFILVLFILALIVSFFVNEKRGIQHSLNK